jgi:hypothetical protein
MIRSQLRSPRSWKKVATAARSKAFRHFDFHMNYFFRLYFNIFLHIYKLDINLKILKESSSKITKSSINIHYSNYYKYLLVFSFKIDYFYNHCK